LLIKLPHEQQENCSSDPEDRFEHEEKQRNEEKRKFAGVRGRSSLGVTLNFGGDSPSFIAENQGDGQASHPCSIGFFDDLNC
jgi:hypothetical protein